MATDDRPLFLVGFMGSGKSTVGERLAVLCDWAFVDTDSLVEERAGKTISEIFERSGEDHFRELEWQVLSSLGDCRATIVAVGGGLFSSAKARRFMQGFGRTIWLDLAYETLMLRAGEGLDRPLWNPGDPLGFRAFFERRRAAYALADSRIDLSGLDAEETARRIYTNFR